VNTHLVILASKVPLGCESPFIPQKKDNNLDYHVLINLVQYMPSLMFRLSINFTFVSHFECEAKKILKRKIFFCWSRNSRGKFLQQNLKVSRSFFWI